MTERHTPIIETSATTRRPLARVLTSISGAAAAWRSRRRGSFLVMVVGTLALLSVFAILYMSIGNQDARAKAATTYRDALDDVPQQFARYIARDIIARDVVSRWYPEDTLNNSPTIPSGWREATDYPSVDWFRRSNGVTKGTFFDPVGTMDMPAEYLPASGNYPVRWNPTDPWLASTEPMYLNFAGVPLPANQQEFMFKVDWGQITNVAPDGRFVNLFNLRNNFEALPGAGTDPTGANRLSTGLSLFSATGVLGVTATDFGQPVGGNPAKNTPAYWTARQRGAFRPVEMNGDALPGDINWPQYQWADADGDGMFDSRWFAMTDWREAAPGQPGHDVRELLDTDGTVRYFFATRIVDLSSMVNVNTASDFRAAPNLANPAGISAADVDLRTLLTQVHRVELDTYVAPPQPSGYDGIPQSTAAENYSGYIPLAAHETAQYGYTALRLALESRTTPPPFGVAGNRYTAPNGGLVTEYATDFGITPLTFLADFATNPAVRQVSIRRYEAALLGTYIDLSFPSGTIQLNGGFGVADTAELLTFRATNDASVNSNLELTLGGRNDTTDPGPTNPATPGSLAFSPLRDNRGAAVESYRSFDTANAKAATLRLFASDLRQRLTGVSGARDLRTTPGADRDVLNASELKINISATNPGAASMFGAYVSGLAPTIRAGWWNTNTGQGAEHMTEFYGYTGPELAVMTAAHMAVNAMDARDSDNTPTSYTVALDRSFPIAGGAGSVELTDQGLPPQDQLFYNWHTPNGRRFDIGFNRMSDTVMGDAATAPAINVFGIEAQPFITQVSTFTVYCDAPGGDDEPDGTPVTIDGRIDATNADFLYRVVAFQLTNPFTTAITLGENMFPQANLHNVLDPTFPPLDRQDGFYYIEFGGKYFKVASLEEQVYIDATTEATDQAANVPSIGNDALIGQYIPIAAGEPSQITINPITIPAGKSVTVYAMSQVPRFVLSERLVPVDSNLPGSPQERLRSTITQAIRNNLDSDADVTGVYWMPEFNAAGDGRINIPGGTGAANTVRDPMPASATTVNLYRAVRQGEPTLPGEGRQANVNVPNAFWDQQTGPTVTSHMIYDQPNLVANDRVVDRFRVTAALDRKLPPTNEPVNGTDALDPQWADVSTVVLWANARRPRDPGIAALPPPSIPAGAFPAYCLEPKYATGWNIISTDALTPTSLNAGNFTGSYNPGGALNPRTWRLDISASLLSNLQAHRAPQNITVGPIVGAGGAPYSNPLIRATQNYAQNYAEIVLPNGQTTGPNATASPARLGDMLLPMGVGPSEKPVAASGSAETNPYLRWTTLGEAMSAALGYENFAGMPAGDIIANYTPQADPLDPGFFISPFDRGNLYLDKFVPFFDADANGLFDATTGDERRGMEIPAAMAVLDAFTVAGPVGQGLMYGRQGVININTAPLMVLRSLPMLCPPPDTEPGGAPWWWWPTANAVRGVDVTSDIAATVHAYREKSDTFARPLSSTFTTAPVDRISFADQPATVTPDAPYADLNGRSVYAEIPAIGELPGFRTVGELLAARHLNSDPALLAPRDYPNNMTFLGYDTRGTTAGQAGNNSFPGVTPVLVDNGGGAPTPDRLSNEYKELLFAFNAASASVTTRSDLFACWFLVHGYKKADVENVKPNEPIVASVQRRFLMILDRSKVTKRGDSAEIVYMKEVPLKP